MPVPMPVDMDVDKCGRGCGWEEPHISPRCVITTTTTVTVGEGAVVGKVGRYLVAIFRQLVVCFCVAQRATHPIIPLAHSPHAHAREDNKPRCSEDNHIHGDRVPRVPKSTRPSSSRDGHMSFCCTSSSTAFIACSSPDVVVMEEPNADDAIRCIISRRLDLG